MVAKLRVVSPLGESIGEIGSLAPRIETLDGKTVCEIWNGAFDGKVTFPIIEEMLRKCYRGVNIVPWTEFPLTTIASGTMGGAKQSEILEDVKLKLLRNKCDAVITGNGG